MAARFTLHHGDCLKVLCTLPSCSVDAIVCDPPAGIAFMGKDWDKDKGGRDAWIAWMQSVAQECLRVIKHGGHALVWALPRTSHWTGMAWENAGWEPRDKITHLFGTGFPKSLDVSKAIDKKDGRLGWQSPNAGQYGGAGGGIGSRPGNKHRTKNFAVVVDSDEAKQWEGWGTALKPAAEDWWLLRKPLAGTVAANVLQHGTGALNIDGCRVGGKRWPANVTTDGSDEVVAGFPDDEARFFYCTKASRRDREEGCEHLEAKSGADAVDREEGSAGLNSPRAGASRTAGKVKNHHPTVKNTDLMRYLCRLVTPKDGVVLDPFMGSGSTGKGCMYEGFRFIGIDQDPEYVEIARARIEYALQYGGFEDEVVVKPAPKAGSSLKVLRKKVSDKQIDLFAQPIAPESQEVLDDWTK